MRAESPRWSTASKSAEPLISAVAVRDFFPGVLHSMASMSADEMFGAANPFIHEHKADYEAGVRRYTEAVLKKALGDLDLHTTRSPEVLASKKE